MRVPRFWCWGAVLLSISILLACGGMNNSNTRVLQTVMVTPATADAQSFPDGRVQFTASGNFSAPPSPVNPLTVSGWTSLTPAVATVDFNSGLAVCVPGATGMATIRASAPSGGPDMPMMGTAVLVSGSAQLSCP